MTAKQEAAQARKERQIFDYISGARLNTLKQAAIDFYNPSTLAAAQAYERRALRMIQARERGTITFFECIRELVRED